MSCFLNSFRHKTQWFLLSTSFLLWFSPDFLHFLLNRISTRCILTLFLSNSYLMHLQQIQSNMDLFSRPTSLCAPLDFRLLVCQLCSVELLTIFLKLCLVRCILIKNKITLSIWREIYVVMLQVSLCYLFIFFTHSSVGHHETQIAVIQIPSMNSYKVTGRDFGTVQTC